MHMGHFNTSKSRSTLQIGALVPLALSAGAALGRPDLYNNGPFVTHPAGGAGGSNLSVVPTILGNINYGASNQLTPAADRVADDFTLSASCTVTSVLVYGFQTNSSTTTSPFTSVNLRIWSGRPGDPGSTVVFGDTTTNRLMTSTWTGCYRARDDSTGNTQRPIFAIEASVSPPLALSAGTYWVDWQVGGTLSSGPFSAYVAYPNLPGAAGANSRWKQGTASNWINAIDGGNFAPQEFPFIIRGTSGGAAPCYPNCDGSTTNPRLSANDFQCFLNSFATASPYANCDGSTGFPALNANDFQCFLNKFAAGCT